MMRACSDAGLSPEHFFERGPEGSHNFFGLPDEPLHQIIQSLDQPDFPVPVSHLPPEELGVIFERLLGTRLQAAEGSRVKRVGKSALLYTGTVDVPPQMVIEFMVNEAINKITDRSAIGGEPVLRILDPACGSGLFLVAVYRYLVRKKIRSPDRPEQIQNILQALAGKSVFGTDIDPESVSAARLVLLFAFIEESRRSGSGVLSPDKIREVCTCLTKAIRCGNSLIAPDYFLGKPVYPFNADERRKVNPFDWKIAFPEIMDEGGFDAVIGAPPPYRPFKIPAREEYFQTHYDAYAPSAGLYGYFIEKGLSLLKPGGIITFLVPGLFLRSRHTRPLRRLLLTRQIVAVTNTGRTRLLPEGDALMYSLTLQNRPPDRPFIVLPDWDNTKSRQGIFPGTHDFTLDQRLFDDGGWNLDDSRRDNILEKIQMSGTPLEQYVMGEIDTGIHRVTDNPLVVDNATKNQLTKKMWWCRHFFIPLLCPVDIRRYISARPKRYVLSIKNNRNFRKCRALFTYLEKAMREQDKKSGFDNNTEYPDSVSGFTISNPGSEKNGSKIIFSQYQQNPVFSYDSEGTCAISHALLSIPRNDPFLLGILNSSLGRFLITHTCPFTDRGYHMSTAAIGQIPIYTPDFDNPDDKARHDRMVALVNEMLDLHKHLSNAKTDQEKRIITQEIESTDRQIDSLVYGLYGLTADEIAVVEEVAGW
jgi:SAM-dependent methyltransferase